MPTRPPGLKAKLFAAAASTAGFRVPCAWCGTPLSYEDATADHHPALSEGGTPRGAVLACDRCNQDRGRETNARVNARRRGKCRKRRKKR